MSTATDTRRERVSGGLAAVSEAVAQMVTGDDWQRWLGFTARISARRPYSARNSLWLLVQLADRGDTSTLVGGYRWWQGMGRQVRKGSSAYWVLAPVTRRLDDADSSEADGRSLAVVGWTTDAVFSLAQTDGEPLPDHPAMSLPEGDGPEGAWEALASFLAGEGWTLEVREIEPELGEARGYTSHDRHLVVVSDSLGGAAALRTLAHEVAHMVMHGGQTAGRAAREVEAESCAYLVCQALGLDTSGATFPYVAGWANGDPAKVLEVASRITKAAGDLLRRLGATDIAADLVAA